MILPRIMPVCLSAGLLMAGSALADTFPGAADNPGADAARRAMQEASQQVTDLLEQQTYQQLNKSASAVQPAVPALIQAEEQRCLPVRGVWLSGITLLSPADLAVLSPLPDNCIRSQDINRLVAQISALYLEKGYITARIQFLPVSREQELGIGVTEGVIERIEGGDRGVNTRMLFPGLTGQPLNITQLDQGLDQANRLRSNRVTMDILPGEQNGGSVIRLTNQRSAPWSLSLTADNYGQKSTGRRLVRATATTDSPAGLSDFASLNVSSTIDEPSQRYSRSGMFFYAVPYGPLTLSTWASGSRYRIRQPLVYHTVLMQGDSAQAALRADYVVHRNQTHTDTLMTQLTYKRSRNYINDTLIGVSSPVLTVAEAGYSRMQIIPDGVISASVSAEKGTTLFGADTPRTLPGSDPQFIKGKFSLSYLQRFALSGNPYLFSSTLTGQYSQNRLPGTEWLTLSDRNAVRGFSDGSLSADKGGYWQNTLSRRFVRQGVSVTPRAGVDYGRVMAQHSRAGWQHAAGAAAGVNISYGGAVLDAELSRARMTTAGAPQQDTVFSLRLGYQF